MIFTRKEVLSYAIDVLTQTYAVFARKKYPYAELYNEHLSLKAEITTCLQDFLLTRNLPPGAVVWREELIKKSITALFKQFANTECLITLGVSDILIAYRRLQASMQSSKPLSRA